MTVIRVGADRLRDAFGPDRASLVAYVMAGYPDAETSLRCLLAAARAGADVIEIGVPYGDALADGPVIAAAGHAARAVPGGFSLADALDVAGEFQDAWIGAAPGVDAPPVVLMTYYNPVLRMGLEEAARRMWTAGLAGSIVPDLPPEAAGPWLEASSEMALANVFLVAPTSTPPRIAAATGVSSGFVYCVSTTGITGERAEIAADLAETVARVRAGTGLPIAVGFGVSTSEQAEAVARLADGVVVGSAIVKRQADPDGLGAFVAELADAVHGAR